MTKPLATLLLECRRTNGARVRFDTSTLELGVVGRSGYLLTYYRVKASRIRSNAQQFFASECAR
jgi:hypothetical protein